MRRISCLLLVTGFLNILAAQQYHFKTEIQIGGDGIWDYVNADSAARRIYVPHGNKVFVIDTDKDAVVREIRPSPSLQDWAEPWYAIMANRPAWAWST
jgi:hypothetical protein